MKKTLAIIAGVVLLGAVVGAYFFPHSQYVLSVGTAGDTNSNRRIAEISMDMTTTTPASQTNNSSQDRIITSVEFYVSGLGSMTGSAGTGVASTTWQMSTSTDVYTAASTNYVLNTTLATSTANGAVGGYLFVASTTPGATGTFANRIWKAGTNLNLFSNATSSANTMAGVMVVNYVVAP